MDDELPLLKAPEKEEAAEAALEVFVVLVPVTTPVKVNVIKCFRHRISALVQIAMVGVSPEIKVRVVKDDIMNKLDIRDAGTKLKLLHNGVTLLEDRTLASYDFAAEKGLHLLVPPSCQGDHFCEELALKQQATGEYRVALSGCGARAQPAIEEPERRTEAAALQASETIRSSTSRSKTSTSRGGIQ